jgi:transcriptional regulator with XRE-family HTH domain
MNVNIIEKEILALLRKLRNEKGLTQNYMAYKLKIAQSAYYKIESGGTSLKITQLIKILQLLDTEIIAFFNMCKSCATTQVNTDLLTRINDLEQRIARFREM